MNAYPIESGQAMPRTGAYLRRIHRFIGLQPSEEIDPICEDHDLAWWLVVSFMTGNVDEEGISIRGWDLVEGLDNKLHERYFHWQDFRTANGE